MHFTLLGLLIASAGFTQTQTPAEQLVLHYSQGESMQNAQEMATAIRTVLEIPVVKVSDGNPPSTLTLGGTKEQLDAAGWIFAEWDRAAPGPQMREYQLSGSGDNVLRIYYVPNAQSVQEFQEIATAVRTVAEVRRLFTYNAPKSVVAGGNPDQMRLMDALMPEIDTPANRSASHSISPRTIIPDAHDEGVTQVYHVANAASVRDFQSLATSLRTIAEIRRVFTYNGRWAIAVRGTDSQMAMSGWMFDQLDQPGPLPAGVPLQYQVPGADDIVRIFDLTLADNGPDLQNLVSQIKSSTNRQAALSFGKLNVLVLRGTAAQIAGAENLVAQLNKH